MDASKVFSEAIKKPEKWVTVHIVPDQLMSFSGSTDDCAQVTIMSIGNLGTEDNIRISKTVTTLILYDIKYV